MGDKYVLRMQYKNVADTFGVNPYENVFAYEDDASGGTTIDLTEIFVANVLPDIFAILSNSVVMLQIYTINLDNLGDFYLVSNSTVGARSGDMIPGFVGWSFRYIRTTREVQDGRKTFAGVAEGDQANGVPTGAATTLLEALEAQLSITITGAGDSYAPRIWRREGYYAPYTGTPPVGTFYPDTFYQVGDVEFTRISTQNTRKR